MSKIIRTPSRAAGGITESERALMHDHTKKWIAVAMRTTPIDPDKLTHAISGLYAAATYAMAACYDMAGDLGVSCAKKWWRCYQGGNMWASLDAYLTAARMNILYALVRSPTRIRQMRDSQPHEAIGLNEGDVIRITPSLDYNPYAEMIRMAAD